MKNLSTKEMSKLEWLKARQLGIGGSDVSAILGFIPEYRTALDVYEDKISPEPIQIEETARMRAGKELEEVVARYWSTDNGYKVMRDNKIRFHPKHDFLLANIDRLIVGNGKGTGVLEVKTTSGFAFKHWEDDGLPKSTYAQIQHYFSVTGHRWGAVAVLVDGYDFHSIHVEADDEFIEIMTKELVSFWNNNVLAKIPPEPTTDQDIKNLYPHSEPGLAIEATKETIDLIKLIRNAVKLRKSDEENETALKVQLKAAIHNAEALTHLGQTIVTYKSSKPSHKFDKKSFGSDHPELLKQYTDEKPGSRRLLFKDVEL